jgi:hypothetical protein
LRFDPPLRRRVCDEVEDHLYESLTSSSAEQATDAARQAIEKFGPPRDLAVQFALAALTKQTKAVGTLAMLVVLGVFLAMRARLMWWGPSQVLQSSDSILTPFVIMRCVFWLSVITGLGGWAYSTRTKEPRGSITACRKWLRRCLTLCVAATTAIVAMVTLDAIFVCLRLMSSGWSDSIAAPLAFLGAELVLAAILILYVFDVMYRTVSTATLFRS